MKLVTTADFQVPHPTTADSPFAKIINEDFWLKLEETSLKAFTMNLRVFTEACVNRETNCRDSAERNTLHV